jgi:hypothetical protein
VNVHDLVFFGHLLSIEDYSSCYKKGENENKLTIHQGNP